jgi:hypothetical protein
MNAGKQKNQDTITLTIETPKGKWEKAEFEKTLKVQDLIALIIDKFKFERDGNYKLKIKGQDETLNPHATLVGSHLKDNMTLVFTDLGKGASL